MSEIKKRWIPPGLIMWLDVAVKAGAIFAGGFAILQYLDARHDAQVEKTLSYVAAFGNSETTVGKARNKISETLWANEDQIADLERLMQRLPAEEAPKLRRRFIGKLLHGADGNNKLQEDLHDVVVFFDTLLVCIDHGLCDRDSARAFFAEYAETIWWNFEEFIEERRTRARDYGIGIETFAAWAVEEL